MPNFNCVCVDETGYETLSQLRRRMMVRLGYAAQADNPPPGMADLLDDFLQSAQRQKYNRFPQLRTERFYRWIMEEGERFYDFRDEYEYYYGHCSKLVNPYKLTWVGIEDTNGVWLPLVQGIPPEDYTAVNYQGIPSRYEVRQCIEVFPAPDAAYTLWVKGHFGLEPFADDDDQTTIDSELVFLWALANAKNHYGQPDARDVAAQAQTYQGDLVAGGHTTARYIPGTRTPLSIPPPIFLPLVP